MMNNTVSMSGLVCSKRLNFLQWMNLHHKGIYTMKTQYLVSISLVSALLVSACSDDKSASTTAVQQQENNPSTLQTAMPQNMPTGAKYFVGQLTETFNAGGYTYVKVASDSGDVWAAGPVTPLKKGDKVSFSSKMLMKNFHSKALNRDFKQIYFAKSFSVNGMRMSVAPKAGAKNPHKSTQATKTSVPLKQIKKAEHGQNIAELIIGEKNFRDKQVKVRGQVSKVTNNIMGSNWVHIRDNSSQKDLIITTKADTQLGNTILVKGKLALNKDFGNGFVIDRVIPDAQVTVE